jgi:hypothetical protein
MVEGAYSALSLLASDIVAWVRPRLLAAVCVATLSAGCMPPTWAANALLHPPRRPVTQTPTARHEKVDLDVGVHLHGWLFRTERPRRGLVVYLHGAGDNRSSPHVPRRGRLARGTRARKSYQPGANPPLRNSELASKSATAADLVL